MGFTMRIIKNLADITHGFSSFYWKEEYMVRGFDPKGIFKTHMISVNYNTYFLEVEEHVEGNRDNEDYDIEYR
jgi:hypothetical protein